MLNTAIVGLGWWGKTLVKAARDFGAPIRFVRGVSLEPDTVRDFAAEHKIALGTSFEEVLADPQIQAVILATPHTKHRAQVEAAAAAKKHIYCEKPFALSKADAVAMLEACQRAGIVIGVGHHFRLMPSMRVLDELKQAGAFGTIMHVEGNYSHDWLANCPADSWRVAAAESRAGGMTGMGIHVLDCFRDLVGPMKRISALSKARALEAADRRHHRRADRIRERRHRHARHHHQDAVRLAHRGLWRELPRRERERDARDRAPRRQGAGNRSTGRPTITSAAIWIISPRPRSGRARSRFRRPASCRRRRRWKRCSSRWTRTGRGWRCEGGGNLGRA